LRDSPMCARSAGPRGAGTPMARFNGRNPRRRCLKDVGCKYVLVGHSERRADLSRRAISSSPGSFAAAHAKSAGLPVSVRRRAGWRIERRVAPKRWSGGSSDVVLELCGPEATGGRVVVGVRAGSGPIGTGRTASPAAGAGRATRSSVARIARPGMLESAAGTRIPVWRVVSVKAGQCGRACFGMPDVDGGPYRWRLTQGG